MQPINSEFGIIVENGRLQPLSIQWAYQKVKTTPLFKNFDSESVNELVFKELIPVISKHNEVYKAKAAEYEELYKKYGAKWEEEIRQRTITIKDGKIVTKN